MYSVLPLPLAYTPPSLLPPFLYLSFRSSVPFFLSPLQRTPFATPGLSILKTITMTTGEFEFDGIFRQAAGGIGAAEINRLGEIPFPHVSYILWIVFIILMPILLTNLLVGQMTIHLMSCENHV